MKVLALLTAGFLLVGCSSWQETRTSSDGFYERRSGSSFGLPPAPPAGYVYSQPPVVLGPPPADAIGYYNDPYYGNVWVGWRPNGYVYLGGPNFNIVLAGRPVPRGFYGRQFYHFNHNYYRPPPPPRYPPPYRPYRGW